MANEIQNTRTAGLIEQIRARTPARILVPRAGISYATDTQLKLRGDHAVALDAVHQELDTFLEYGLSPGSLFEVMSAAYSKKEYLLRPDLGRILSEDACREIVPRCPRGRDVQFVIGDGLSALAVERQVPAILPRLTELAAKMEWTLGQPFVVRYCRVGIINDIGRLLEPNVVVLLIGERPGLATSESLSAYLAFRPRPGHTDAQRNLISNIHARGIPPLLAAERIILAISRMLSAQSSGVGIDISGPEPLPLPPPKL